MTISLVVLLLFAMPGDGSEEEEAASAAVATVRKHMTPDQLALDDPIVNSIGMLLVPIPAGEYQMGSPESDSLASDNEKTQHLVRITEPFYLSVFVITQQQYEKVMGGRPWQRQFGVQEGPGYPATYVSWHNAVEFCRKLSEQEGVEYHLPTEAQWEYACRAGTTSAYSFEDDVSQLGQHAWYKKNASGIGETYAHRVGQKLPNPWGLYDMHGNIWEWCQDWYAPYGSEQAVSDPVGPMQGASRVSRGGAFNLVLNAARSATRITYPPAYRNGFLGFRAARTFP